MGILRFLSTVSKFFPRCLQDPSVGKERRYESVFVDFNGFIHDASAMVCSELFELSRELPHSPKDDKRIVLPDGTVYSLMNEYNARKSSRDWRIQFAEEEIEPKKDGYIISKAVALLEEYLNAACDLSTLRLIYISIDGVPDKAKMQEQRHRKCAGAIVSEFGKLLARDIGRQTWSSWNKNKIMPFSDFMRQMEDALRAWSAVVEEDTGIECILNDALSPGEGETKIVRFIQEELRIGVKSPLLVLSPDADMILEMMPVACERPVDILRKSVNGETMCILNVNAFNSYMLQFPALCNITELEYIQSLSACFLLLGNDYIPSMPSLNCGRDLTLISRIHQAVTEEVLCIENRNETDLLVKENGELNYEFLIAILRHLAMHEHSFIHQGQPHSDNQEIERAISYKKDHPATNTFSFEHISTTDQYKGLKRIQAELKNNGATLEGAALILPHVHHPTAELLNDYIAEKLDTRVASFCKRQAKNPLIVEQRLQRNTTQGGSTNAQQSDVYTSLIEDLENMEGVFMLICDNQKKLPLQESIEYYRDYVGGDSDTACEEYIRGIIYALEQQLGTQGQRLCPGETFSYELKRSPLASDLRDYVCKMSRNSSVCISSPEEAISPLEHVILTMPMTEDNVILLPPPIRACINGLMKQNPGFLLDPQHIKEISELLFAISKLQSNDPQEQLELCNWIDGRDRKYLSRAFFKFMHRDINLSPQSVSLLNLVALE